MIFAIYKAKPTPFFILDEIDAALDKKNTAMLSTFLRSEASEKQIVIVSHRDKIYSEADTLIGICKDYKMKSSCSYILNLAKIVDKDYQQSLKEPEAFIWK